MPQALSAGIWGFIFMFPLFSRAEFYSFEENAQSSWVDPVEIIFQTAKSVNDLLKWSTHSGDRPVASEKYNRIKHFGTWVDDPRTDECYDTRALVLIRDSQVNVKFSTGNPCKIYSGEWNDPYGGSAYKMARDIEIDHVVALKNAYDSGAFGWDYQQRCLYANFLGYDKHLLAAASAENNAKSDHGPEDWMPSDSGYACQHLQNWLVIKFLWKLNMTEAEAVAIENEVQQNHCELKMFQFSKAEVAKIRRFAQQNLELCKLVP
jgi:hypothetical protein